MDMSVYVEYLLYVMQIRGYFCNKNLIVSIYSKSGILSFVSWTIIRSQWV